MDLGSLLLIIALLVFVAVYVTRPLFAGRASLVSQREHHYSELLAERDRLIDALLELDFDHDLGKIPADIFASQRADLVQRGANVLRQLDEFGKRSAEEKKAREALSQPDDPLEDMIAARRKAKPDVSKSGAHYCHGCGTKLLPGDRFCPRCGTSQGRR